MLHKLHLGACQLKHVTIFQDDGLGAYWRTMEMRLIRSFDVRNDKTMWPFGDGCDCHARLAYRGDHFYKRHLPTGGSARHDLYCSIEARCCADRGS